MGGAFDGMPVQSLVFVSSNADGLLRWLHDLALGRSFPFSAANQIVHINKFSFIYSKAWAFNTCEQSTGIQLVIVTILGLLALVPFRPN